VEGNKKICARCGYIRTAEDDLRFKEEICPSCNAYYHKSEKYFRSQSQEEPEPDPDPKPSGVDSERLATYALLSSLVFIVVAAAFLSYVGFFIPWWVYLLGFVVFFGSAYHGFLKNAALEKYLKSENGQDAPPPSLTGKAMPPATSVEPRRSNDIFGLNRKLGPLDYFFMLGAIGLMLYIFAPPISGSYKIASGGAACDSIGTAREFQIVRRQGFFRVGRFLSSNNCIIGPHHVSVVRRATVFSQYAKVRTGGEDYFVFRDDLVRRSGESR